MKAPALEARQGMQLHSIRWDRLAQLAATSRTGFVAITTVLVIFGAIRLVQATPFGLGLNGDSFYYVTGAERGFILLLHRCGEPRGRARVRQDRGLRSVRPDDPLPTVLLRNDGRFAAARCG